MGTLRPAGPRPLANASGTTPVDRSRGAQEHANVGQLQGNHLFSGHLPNPQVCTTSPSFPQRPRNQAAVASSPKPPSPRRGQLPPGAAPSHPSTRCTPALREPMELPSYIPGQSIRNSGSAMGSAFMHKGFFDILSLANDRRTTPQDQVADLYSTPVPSRFRSTISKATDAFRRTSRVPVELGEMELQHPEDIDNDSTGKEKSSSPLKTPPIHDKASTKAASITSSPASKSSKKRISVNMVSAPRPDSFIHAAHASDEQEALAILERWTLDGMGKVADPNWVGPIKQALRSQAAQAQAEAIARIQANLHSESIFRTSSRPSLQIVNGLPSSSSVATLATLGASGLGTLGQGPTCTSSQVEPETVVRSGETEERAKSLQDQIDSDQDQTSPLPAPWGGQGTGTLQATTRPSMPRTNTAGTTFVATPLTTIDEGHDYMQFRTAIEDGEETVQRYVAPPAAEIVSPRMAIDKLFECPAPRPSSVVVNEEENAVESVPRPLRTSELSVPMVPIAIRPSLTTVEKSVAAKIFFENLYYGILKKPAARETRRAGLEKELIAMRIPEASKEAIRQAWIARETEHLRALRARVSPNSFVKLKTIGHGAFGVVALVRERESGQLYAMKQLRKADMLRKGQEGHTRAERDLMTSASSSGSHSRRWIVNLIYSFQDTDQLYLVMEFMGGGDLLNLLIEKDIFPEDFARFYIAEMILAIHEAHRLGYIHRDIKPDNFLFTSGGHIKLADFGLCQSFHWAHDGAYYDQQRRNLLHKHGIDLEDAGGGAGATRKRTNSTATVRDIGGQPSTSPVDLHDLANDRNIDGSPLTHVLTYREKQRRQVAYSIVGTNNYMAPEVLRGRGYDGSCDWWSLGVITYECLYGYPPFVTKSRQLTRHKILNWRQHLKFPSKPKISREAQDFVARLLCDKDDRLGSQSSASVSRPNSLVVNARRQSGGLGSAGMSFDSTSASNVRGGGGGLHDGVDELMNHPWFRGVDWTSIHRQSPPFIPSLSHPADTKHFEDDIADEVLPSAAVQAAKEAGLAPPMETARDPMLRDRSHGERLLEMRKALAFVGYTFKRPPGFDLADLAQMREEEIDQALGLGQVNKERRQGVSRLVGTGEEGGGSRIRAMSM